jgi:hypothetical protein
MLTVTLSLSTLIFVCLWLEALWRLSRARNNFKTQSRKQHAQLANAIIRVRHAFVSDVYRAETISRDKLLKEAMDCAGILAQCEIIVEKLTSTPTAASHHIHIHMNEIQQLVERCGNLKDPFFRDTCLFYIAGLLEHGKRPDEAQLLRNSVKHGTIRAKALQSKTLILEPPLPEKIRVQLSAAMAQPVSPSRVVTTRKRAASALDWPLVTGFMRYCSKIRSKTVM